MKFHLGVDVGGTFTDAVLIDVSTGETRRAKVRSTPEGDQSIGVLNAISAFDVSPEDIALFTHGHTVAINALLQRNGARTGLICTEGTRDMLDMGRLRRPFGDDLYDAAWERPHQARPLVHRRHVRDVPGRILYDGSVHVGLDEQAVREEAAFLRSEGVESLAVCLLHGYVNDEHERRVLEIVREEFPEAYLVSSSLRPVVGEYDRTCTVVLNAYTGPVINRYLERLRDELRAQGHGHEIQIMQMNGGVRSIEDTIDTFPAYTIQSGPVGGLLGAEAYVRDFVNTDNLICIDVGGTSTDIGVVAGGEALRTDDWEVEFGIRLGFPSIDVRSIGAGGGSLIQIDELGTLRIGPESAGADPGPACYGRGGTRPTVTDALVVMGVVQPELFLAGDMPLSPELAVTAMKTVADPLGLAPEELARGVFALINGQIDSEVSKIAFEQALDLSEFSVLAYGGAGPVHAASLARALGARSAIIPFFPGGFSALGMLAAPVRVEHAVSVVQEVDSIGLERVGELFDELEQRVRADLARQGATGEQVVIERRMDGMYTGQSFANTIPLRAWPATDEAIAEWKRDFHSYYEKVYGYSALETPIVVTTFTVVGSGERRALQLPRIGAGEAEPPADAVELQATVHFDEGSLQTPFFRRQALLAGNRIPGPAVIDDGLATVLVPPDGRASVDDFGNIHIDVREERH